jgi:hypothetical protein
LGERLQFVKTAGSNNQSRAICGEEFGGGLADAAISRRLKSIAAINTRTASKYDSRLTFFSIDSVNRIGRI